MASIQTPTAAAAEVPIVRDGSSPASAAASCWEIKQNFPTKPTGPYWLQTDKLTTPQRFFCDQDYRGGGWVLLGRGRDGWTANYEGQGDPDALLTRTRKPDQFVPVQLASTTIDGLMNGGRVDAMADGILLRRSNDWWGNQLTDMNWSMNRDRWVWTFGAGHPLTWSTYDWGARYWNGTSDYFGINQSGYRAITTFLPKNNYKGGWAFGSGTYGGDSPDVYQWSPTGGNNPLPYSELYIRPQITSNNSMPAIPDSGVPAVTKTPIASSYAAPTRWGLTGVIPGTPAKSEGNTPAQSFAQIGNTMFVGGNFTTVQRGAAAAESFAQTGLAAFNATTGEPITTFRPVFNNQVKTLLRLPNGSLLVGGDFTQVNGEPRVGLVALNPTTGAIDPNWTAVLENRVSPGTVRVRDLELAGDMVYVSGQFTHTLKATGAWSAYTRNAARINWRTSSPDTTWNPEFNGTVYDGDVSEDGKVFWAAGWFTTSQSNPSFRAAAVSTAPGAALVLNSSNVFLDQNWSEPGTGSYQQTVQQVGNRVYFGGSQHSIFGFDISNLNRTSGTLTQAGGDFQALTASNGVIYGGCHCNNYAFQDSYKFVSTKPTNWTQADKISWFGAWDAATGKYIPGFNPPELGSAEGAGTWGLYTADDGAIWAGGDFTSAKTSRNSTQWVGGFVRFPQIKTTAPDAPTNFFQLGNTADSVTLSWQAQAGVDYEVLRNDRVAVAVPNTAGDGTLSVTTARGGADRFFVRAVDSDGNRSATTPVLTVKEMGTVPTPLVAKDATWSYSDTKTAPAAGWFGTSYDATTWRTGKAPLGWGGADIATNLDKPATERAKTMYFRNQFNIDSLTGVTQVTLNAVADDGTVVYVNGQELGRLRMDTTVPTHTTSANAAVSYTNATAQPLVLDVPISMLKVGTNTIAAETHLNYTSTPSASFSATLTNTTATQTSTAPAAPTGLKQTGTTAAGTTLAWNAVTGATTYEVLRDGYVVATTNTTTATAPTGTDNTYTVRALTADGRRSGPSTPVTATDTTELIAKDATWSYSDTKAAPAAGWFGTSYDATTWRTGKAPLGWGGADIATNLDKPATERARTMYFRNQFNIATLTGVTQVTLSAVADDGAVVYVNGQELGRLRMDTAQPTPDTSANAAVSYTNATAAPLVLDVPVSMLKVGTNTIAAETHLNYTSTPSASFSATLTNTTATQTSAAPAAPTGLKQTGTTADATTLTWNAVSGASSYEVLRDGYVVATTNTTTATAPTGTDNTYTVRALTTAGRRSGPSTPVTGTPTATPVELINQQASWDYYYNLAAPAAGWNQTGATGTGWQTNGAAPLGWGGAVATNLDRPTTERAKTMYFRKNISIADRTKLGTVTISVVADDGTVVYVNGTEIGRVRMPDGAITHTTNASANISYSAAHAAPVTIQVPAQLLVNGTNTIAAETHLNYTSAPSASFALAMTSQ